MRRPRRLFLNAEEQEEIIALCTQATDEHEDTVKELVKDDSTNAEEFRTAIADENRRQIVRQRIADMLKGGE